MSTQPRTTATLPIPPADRKREPGEERRHSRPRHQPTRLGRYFPQLANLARKTLGENPRRVADEEDAVISVFATFWKRVNRGEFSDLAGRDSLWKLMAVITIRKAIKQTRRESTAKRGGAHRVLTETDAAPIPGQPFLDTIRQVAGDVSFEEMDSLGYELMESLPDADLRSIALLKLMG